VKEAVADDAQNEEESYPELKKEKKQHTLSVQFLTVKVRGLAYKAKKKDVKQFFHPLKPSSVRLPPKNKGIAYVGFKSEKELRQALNKHLTFLGKLYTYCILQNVCLTTFCRDNCRRNLHILGSIFWEK
jgi:multiple RNA-binding domain-containing protein 1